MNDPLEFNIKAMCALGYLPSSFTEKGIKRHVWIDLFFCCVLGLTLVGTFGDLYRQVVVGVNDGIVTIIDGMITLSANIFLAYYILYMKLRRQNIMELPKVMKELNRVDVPADVEETERKSRFLSKIFLTYGSVGPMIYWMLPFLFIHECKRLQAERNIHDSPCGISVRFWYPFDTWDFPGYHFCQFLALLFISLFGTINMVVTFLQCSIVMHLVGHIRHLKNNFNNAFSSENIQASFSHCVFYHNEIIKCCEKMNACFSEMSFAHSFAGSLIISALAFQVNMISTVYDQARFWIHLLGWVFVLFFRNFLSQQLVDESLTIADAVFHAGWQNSKPTIQRGVTLVIMRSQRALAITKGKFGFLSLEEFYSTMAAAYSYYTLLSKTQNK